MSSAHCDKLLTPEREMSPVAIIQDAPAQRFCSGDASQVEAKEQGWERPYS